MTTYRTVCGCLTSDSPHPGEYMDEAAFRAAYEEWQDYWANEAGPHHEYCCQLKQREGAIDRCLVGPNRDCPVIAEAEREEVECIYCGRAAIEAEVPAVADDEAWADLRLAHAPGCEWIATRAHRVEG